MFVRLWSLWCTCHLVLGLNYKHDYRGFDDSILYDLEWPGKEGDLKLEELAEYEKYTISSTKNEPYTCYIPLKEEVDKTKEAPYSGNTPFELVAPIFIAGSCSYRIDSYWTYEVCHGNYIKQFHEERDRMQEYYLGKFDMSKLPELEENLLKTSENGQRFQQRKIDGNNMAYIEVEMGDGTLCDLNNEPRSTKVLYVCYAHGKNEIYSLKETSTCNYEVIILTPTLCAHPMFKSQDVPNNQIKCIPDGDAPKKPEDLYPFEVTASPTKDLVSMSFEEATAAAVAAALGLDLSSPFLRDKNQIAILKYDKKDGTLKMELIQNSEYLSKLAETIKEDRDKTGGEDVTSVVTDTTPVKEFLSGKHCLIGGTGWWKYEFCYGRYVRQYHGETSLILGFFDDDKHKQWIDSHPQKLPKPIEQRRQLSHFYQGGSVCDKTGKKRETEVVLKCMENASPSKVSLYLLEPTTCQYILGVESPLICDILAQADPATGLIPQFKAPEAVEQFTIEEAMDELQVRLEND